MKSPFTLLFTALLVITASAQQHYTNPMLLFDLELPEDYVITKQSSVYTQQHFYKKSGTAEGTRQPYSLTIYIEPMSDEYKAYRNILPFMMRIFTETDEDCICESSDNERNWSAIEVDLEYPEGLKENLGLELLQTKEGTYFFWAEQACQRANFGQKVDKLPLSVSGTAFEAGDYLVKLMFTFETADAALVKKLQEEAKSIAASFSGTLPELVRLNADAVSGYTRKQFRGNEFSFNLPEKCTIKDDNFSDGGAEYKYGDNCLLNISRRGKKKEESMKDFALYRATEDRKNHIKNEYFEPSIKQSGKEMLHNNTRYWLNTLEARVDANSVSKVLFNSYFYQETDSTVIEFSFSHFLNDENCLQEIEDKIVQSFKWTGYIRTNFLRNFRYVEPRFWKEATIAIRDRPSMLGYNFCYNEDKCPNELVLYSALEGAEIDETALFEDKDELKEIKKQRITLLKQKLGEAAKISEKTIPTQFGDIICLQAENGTQEEMGQNREIYRYYLLKRGKYLFEIESILGAQTAFTEHQAALNDLLVSLLYGN